MAMVLNAWLAEWFLGCIAMIIFQVLQLQRHGVGSTTGNMEFWGIVFLIQCYRYYRLRRKLEAPWVKGKL